MLNIEEPKKKTPKVTAFLIQVLFILQRYLLYVKNYEGRRL